MLLFAGAVRLHRMVRCGARSFCWRNRALSEGDLLISSPLLLAEQTEGDEVNMGVPREYCSRNDVICVWLDLPHCS